MAKKMGPYQHKLIRAAAMRGLFVTTNGQRDTVKEEHEFVCRTTGEWRLSYYPKRKYWRAIGRTSGSADTFEEALEKGLGPVPPREVV